MGRKGVWSKRAKRGGTLKKGGAEQIERCAS